MSAKTIGFPSNPSLDQEYQGWVWDGEKWVSDAVKGGGDDIWFRGELIGPDQSLAAYFYCLADRSTTDPTFQYRPDNGEVMLKVDRVQSTEYVDENNNSIIGSSLWEESGDDIYYNDGNVGIGTDSPSYKFDVGGGGRFTGKLHVEERLTVGAGNPSRKLNLHNDSASIVAMELRRDNTAGGGTENSIFHYSNDGLGRIIYEAQDAGGLNRILSNNDFSIQTSTNQKIDFRTNGSNDPRMTIDAAGNVGIGMAPEVRTAKEQLAEWKSQFDARLKDDPKADKKAVTLEITDDAFEVLPTEDKLAEWMETRAAGDKLQVDGNATFWGTVDAAGFTVNGQPISGGGGGLPDGDYTYNGIITAKDFIATSDERLKDNITPIPIGLIDDIKPVSWDWKDGSGTSAGVVAQQLQAVGLGDYVHENEDGQLGVNYQALTAILLAEVIELKKAIK